MLREFYEVYANYPNKPAQKIAGYSKETALKVLEDETVKAIMKTPHLTMIDGRTGEIVAESKLDRKLLEKIVQDKIQDIFVEYQNQQCIISGDISPMDDLYLDTIIDSLVNCIYEICDKNRIVFSHPNNTLTNFLAVGQYYDFRTELTKYGGAIYAKNTDGEDVVWIKYITETDEVFICGNTDNCNLWFCDTRSDLTPEKLISFVKDLNEALKMEEPILLRHLIDPEDWQEIADVRDASKDERYMNN